jgi:hypothetical protein
MRRNPVVCLAAGMEKPTWINALEESLLLAIGLFSLITWIVVIGLVGH